MNFVCSESLQRHAYVDVVVSETLHNLQHNTGVQERLERTMRDGYIDRLQNSFVPNLQHGVLTIPKARVDTDDTPITPLFYGEKVICGNGFGIMTPAQGQSAEKILDILEFGKEDIVETLIAASRALRNIEGKHELRINDLQMLAFVTRFSAYDAANDHIYAGRPLMTLMLNRAQRTPRLECTADVVHELRHVDQALETPIANANDESLKLDRLRRELEAYHVGAHYGWGLFESDDPRYEGNEKLLGDCNVEAIRDDNTPEDSDDPFAPTQAIIDALAVAGEEDIYL